MKPLTQDEAALRERVRRFDTWAFATLAKHLPWPDDPAQRAREIGRARNLVWLLCMRLAQRGFHFDGIELARRIEALIVDVASRHREGQVTNLFAYIRAAFESHVATNADRLREDALRLGCHASQREDASKPLVEAIGERWAEAANKRMAARRRRWDAQAAADDQGELLHKGTITKLSNQARARCAESSGGAA